VGVGVGGALAEPVGAGVAVGAGVGVAVGARVGVAVGAGVGAGVGVAELLTVNDTAASCEALPVEALVPALVGWTTLMAATMCGPAAVVGTANMIRKSPFPEVVAAGILVESPSQVSWIAVRRGKALPDTVTFTPAAPAPGVILIAGPPAAEMATTGTHRARSARATTDVAIQSTNLERRRGAMIGCSATQREPSQNVMWQPRQPG
jgi:hypothetical protein